MIDYGKLVKQKRNQNNKGRLMGDRCPLTFSTTAKEIKNAKKATKAFLSDPCIAKNKGKDGEVVFYLEEANWGCVDELQEAAAEGFTAIGRHGAGDTYPAQTFVLANGCVHYASEGGASARINPDGFVNKEDYKSALAYIKAEKAAKKKLGWTEKWSIA